jgi:hypothetical protein
MVHVTSSLGQYRAGWQPSKDTRWGGSEHRIIVYSWQVARPSDLNCGKRTALLTFRQNRELQDERCDFAASLAIVAPRQSTPKAG